MCGVLAKARVCGKVTIDLVEAVMVSRNHDCRIHGGEEVGVGPYTVWAGGCNLSADCLDEVDTVVSLAVQQPDLRGFHVEHLLFIIKDFGVAAGLERFLRETVLPRLAQGKTIAFHCFGGFGRTGMVLAGLIALLEPDVDPIVAVRERYCPGAVETPDQAAFVHGLESISSANEKTREVDMNAVKAPADDQKWYMAGTEGTGEYQVIARNALGRLGFRSLGSLIRVRVEPSSDETASQLAESFSRERGWKQPGDNGENRFSCVVTIGDTAVKTVEGALKSLSAGDRLDRNTKVRYWRADVKA
jgi:hypothetical protein